LIDAGVATASAEPSKSCPIPTELSAQLIGTSLFALTPKDGMPILDVVAGKIVAVEVLYRDEIRQELHTEFP